MRFWHVLSWALLAVFMVLLTLMLVRGPEDTYVLDATGRWVAHGNPAGPAPPPGYQAPLLERVGPVLFLIVLMAAVVTVVRFSGRSPTGRDQLDQGIRYFGAVSITCTFAAIGLALALIVGMACSPGHPVFVDQTIIVLCLLGAIALLKLLSWHAYTTKKVMEAHYDLKRSVDLLQETLERLKTQ